MAASNSSLASAKPNKAKQTPRRTLRISLSNNVTGVQCSGSCLVSQASGRWWTCIRDSMALTPSPGALSLRSDLPDLPACRLCSPRPLHFESVCRPNSRQPCPRGVPVHDCPLSPCALCSCVCSAMVVGDFNAFPGSAVYELLRRGRLHGPYRAVPCRLHTVWPFTPGCSAPLLATLLNGLESKLERAPQRV